MIQETISTRIKLLRKFYDLNQTDFAQKLGLQQGAISAIEKGGNPSYEAIKNIFVNIDKLNFAWLFRGEGEMFVVENGKGDIQELEERIKEFEQETRDMKEERRRMLITIENLSKR